MNPTHLLRFGSRALRTWFGRLAQPYKLTFAVTNRCNLRCAWCNIWQTEPVEELSHEEIERFFTANQGLVWVDLTGGEILLRTDILDIIHAAARLPHLFQLHFPTNGTMPDRTEEAVRAAVGLRIPKVVVSISLDGPPEEHDALRGRAGTWDSAVETYKRIRRVRGAEVYIGMTLTSANLHSLERTLASLTDRLAGFGPRDLHLNIAHSTFYYGSPKVPPFDVDETEEVLQRFTRLRGIPTNPVLLLELLYQRKIPRYLTTGCSPISCQALASSLFIDAQGSVFPCTSYDMPIGNLRDTEYRLEPLWKTKRTIDLARQIRRGKCPGCWTPCEAYQSIIAALPRPSTWW